MNKTGLKTFVCSFVLTLSTIIGVDKAFFYTPYTAEETIKIPRKNISLFFSGGGMSSSSFKVDTVQKIALKTPYSKTEELKIADNLPVLPPELEVKDVPIITLDDDLSSQQIVSAPEVQDKNTVDADIEVPLVYSGMEKDIRPIGSAQQVVDDVSDVVENKVVATSEDLLSKPMVIKATRQLVKIDNLKKYQERLKEEDKFDVSEEVSVLTVAEDVIPLQNENNKEEGNLPEKAQVASLGSDVQLVDVEKQVLKASEDKRQWQTMAEKHKDESPWLVARGSKFVKNKKVLDEEFSSDNAKESAEALLPKPISDLSKTTKVAVQDNLLIPIPQDLLDEDDLIPALGDGVNIKPKDKAKPQVKKDSDEGSFLDSLASVFSKENREKAIQSLKKRSGKYSEDTVKKQILPTEIRLSFQPNRAEISGQTLRWVQAFAKKAAEESDVGLEIRMDGSSAFALQQKRLNLLYNILTANGVAYQKINTIFADREQNSFVVRTVKITNGNKNKKEIDGWKKYYQQW